jgi:hypothetical protein
MGGARALIASLGASISLVAGAAVSLLVFSVVFALPGFTGSGDAPRASAPVVVEARVAAEQRARGEAVREASTAVLISAPKTAPAARPGARRPAAARLRKHAADTPSFNPGLTEVEPAVRPPAAATPSTPKPALGDGVRGVGDAVTATVQGTGDAATPLLGPPVSQAIQDVLDLLTSVLEGATSTLGGALDAAVPR